jgi:acyl-CoA synthetase (NDP forming)
LAQSGAVALQLMNIDYMNISYSVSSGNNAVVDIVDYLEFMVDDEYTNVIALYLEGVRDAERFTQVLAKAAQKRKPIVMLKSGISAKGQRAAAAHTGNLAGSSATFDALFERFGVIRVYDMEELLSTSLLFSSLKNLPEQGTFAIMNLSGGDTVISADLAYLYNIELPDFHAETLAKLRELLPDYATPNNPLDMTATLAYDPERYRQTLRTVMADPSIGMVLVGATIPEQLTPANRMQQLSRINGILDVAKEPGSKPIGLLSSISGKRAAEIREMCYEAHVPILPCPKYSFSSLKSLTKFINYNPHAVTMEVAVLSDADKAGKENLEVRTLSEHESKELLRQYGIPVPKERVVKSETELVASLETIGYPAVLKIDSPDVPHKSDVGAVKLNIKSETDALAAYKEILANVAAHKPEARINGVLVQQMLPKGLEAIVGISRDDQFGPMVLVGLGGVFVEVFKDAALKPIPLSKKEALEMIDSLKAAPLFKGYRGAEVLDLDALAEVIVSVARLAADKRAEIRELDINPLFVYPQGKGVGVADALVVLG